MFIFLKYKLSFLILLAVSQQLLSQVISPEPYWHGKERIVRYHPEGTDFVITNGERRFTRALYGTNTAFRVEAGDLPEFALYMPGMGGNLKFGLIGKDTSKWLIHVKKITARYRPGSMIYDIEDDLLGNGKLHLTVLAMADAEGVIVKVAFENVQHAVELFWAFGGSSGKKFARDGDMGPDPESSFYLKPEYCKDNRYEINGNAFTLKYGTGEILSEEDRYEVKHLPAANEKEKSKKGKEQSLLGMFPPASVVKIGDAAQQNSPQSFFLSGASATPAIVGKLQIKNKEDTYFAIQNAVTARKLTVAEMPVVFKTAEEAREKLADRIVVKTPDPYINTVGGALAMAADAIWEAPSYLHGSIGWRMRLNGWRGPYTGDPLGWHDRARLHFRSYALSQLTSPDSGKVVADTALHLARQLEKLGTSVFSKGYISRNPGGDFRPHHYDMNLVFIDELLWHFQWTGDLDFVKEMWPVLQSHLAWEKRNFDKDGDGLYDAYAAIWASDALEYSGGGVTHSSAYNYRANKKAAAIARLIGKDDKPYEAEATKILNALNSKLWMPAKGWYAEYKDLLGGQLLHPAAALWTVYHSIDSDVPDAFQSYQTVRYVDAMIPHIPVQAKGLEDGYYTLSTTNWMPYEWSLNNVAMAEVLHTSLANWEAGRNEEAFKLWKSEILESMYLGGSPGNIGQISFYDANRGEAYRDFGDPIGIMSRTLVEGLFGILPDALNGQLTIRPGFPAAWNSASLHIPDIHLDFNRVGATETYTISPLFQKQLRLKLLLKAYADSVKEVWINNRKSAWKNVDSAVGEPIIEINSEPADQYLVKIIWKGDKPDTIQQNKIVTEGSDCKLHFSHAVIAKVFDPQQVWKRVQINGSDLQAVVSGTLGSRTAFVQLKQGELKWWQPVNMDCKEPLTVVEPTEQSKNGLQFRLQNNTSSPMQGILRLNDNYPMKLNILASSISDLVKIPFQQIIPGSNELSYLWNGRLFHKNIINWRVDNTNRAGWEPVNLSPYFNDYVTQIFRNQYLSPRPASPTLQLPTQGISEWTAPLKTFRVDDKGLRKLAGKAGVIILPQGIPFSTPGDSLQKNIVFTSQWDNYPRQSVIPLTGKASHAYFLMAGSTNPMQSRLTNGVITIQYTDGSSDSLVLKNPETWWPIEQDYLDDGYAFKINAVRPVRVHLKTGKIITDDNGMKQYNGKMIDGGAATVFDLPLQKNKTLLSLILKTVANDVVIGLMSVTLLRP